MTAGPELVRVELGEDQVDVRLLDLARLGDPESAAAEFLTSPEATEYAELRHPLRRREWLGARVCLKLIAVGQGRVADARGCAVVKDPSGRPRLVFTAGSSADVFPDCSLSHKGRFAGAAASTVVGSRVGVDIEEVSPRLRRLADRFADERDTVLGSRPTDERLAILWALKEACSKVVGQGLALALREVTCQEIAPGRHRVVMRGRTLSGRHVRHDDYVVALCVGTDQDVER
ncbi:MAG: 4'-phosphopantetheinyl transferase family protein [Candidatus Rokuibacteriota bacterium]